MKNLIQRRKKQKWKKAEENVGGGGRGRTDTAGVYVSVHFMLEAGQCGHRFGRLCG